MKGYNIKFPFKDDTEKNTYIKLNQITKDGFGSNLLFLLLTEKGERYYDSKFGTNLLKFVFDPNDELTQSDVQEDIKQTVSKYMPNLTITKVSFNKIENGNGLNVNVKFVYNENTFSESGELDINF